MTLVAILTVRQDAREQFRTFARHAAGVMRTHGGRFDRTVIVTPDPGPGLPREIHLVTFPDEPAFLAYRADARRAELAHLRDASVVATHVLIGEDGPDYGAA